MDKEEKMTVFRTRAEYERRFGAYFQKESIKLEELSIYTHSQFYRLDRIVGNLTADNFWIHIPEILGIDARLVLLCELIEFDNLSSKEIIRIVENDYRHYFKELCGFGLSEEQKHSLIFNVI